ncbi:neprilysin-4-like [Ruditapes philippinarum]|uniref:neprilysin-4-like n=1 Tax=Ruditapes philippinarum TaxID=129788 RepID=UPI00295BB298|nr:neprilysin-4-like [Ruditapes philippinarum]XP_060595477.1 neprilysin-4-like [Ruditapes philippinarum]
MNGGGKHYVLANGETVVTYEPSGKSRRSYCCGRTYLEVVLLFVSFICSGIAVALVIVLATRPGNETIRTITITETGIGYSSSHNDKSSENLLAEQSDGRYIDDSHKLCLTEDCVKAAARLLESMDNAVDPCEDFFEYACGSWNKFNEIPEDGTSYDTFSKLRDIIDIQLKDLLEHPESDDDSESTIKAKRLYSSCVNETLIDDRDLAPAFVVLEDLGGWPVADKEWDKNKFDLIDLLAKLRLYNNKILIDQWVGPDDKNSDDYIIQLDQTDLGMSSRDYYMKGFEDPRLLAYEEFAVNVAILFGASNAVAKKDMRDVINFEIKLANLTTPQEHRRDSEALYNKMTLKDLQNQIPKFDWIKYLHEIFIRVNVTVNDTDTVVVYAPEYLKKMIDLVDETEERTLTNYIIWRFMMNRVPNLPGKYRELRTEYYKAIFGSKQERVRWRDCVSYVNDNLGNAVGRLFVSKHFDEDAKKNALEMVQDIRVAVNELLTEVEWMDEATKHLAKDKADAMAVKIGYPSYILNDTALDEEYKNFNYHADKYFENVLETIRGIAITSLQMIDKPVDKTLWSTTPAIVNAFYASTKNQIMFPAGILQPPFYSKGYPKSLNYGGIGMVIGHEITHGFDDRGRQYDKNGNLKQWWDDDVIAAFKKQAQCIVDQYSNYTIEEVELQINGIQTQGENIADNGGLKETYRAYKKWKKEHKGQEPRLPGLTNLNSEQLFFLNFAQVWCGTTRPQAMVNRILTGVHSPGRYRVIGTLQNSVDFSKVFNCSLNSYMNPEKKCSVW